MGLRATLLLVVCSGCNALTGVSDLEQVACTTECTDASTAADTRATDTGAPRDTGTPADTNTSGTDATSLCANGSKDPGESDVDCGGSCAKCALGKACATDADCANDHCVGGKCAQCPTGMVVVGGPTAAFCIDTRETTNAEYKAWITSSPSITDQPAYCSWNTTFQPSVWPPGPANLSHPVRYVDWCDAYSYCASKKKRLCGKIGGGPSPYAAFADAAANEWYRACTQAGTRAYPYGTTYDPDYCNGAGNTFGTTVPVASLTTCTNAFGTFDMSGNVSEWEDSCSASAGAMDSCRVRGGSYRTADPKCGLSEVLPRQTVSESVGIRCCDD